MIGLNEGGGAADLSERLTELTAATFAEGGWLERHLNLEHRPQQAAMARAVAAAFRDDEPLLFEAGTGVGKSLAYLIPGILHAVDSGRPCVVSTHTISLQEQIEQQDLPGCRRLFAAAGELAAYAEFKSAVLVGKANYLCTTRLAQALAEKATLFSDGDYAELQRIADWAERSATGIRHELQPAPVPEIWDQVNADGAACSRRNCDCERCFYQRARTRLRAANVIVVNHALLFALIAAGGARAEGAGAEGRGVLFPDDFVVLDEAHTVPEVATTHFGISLGSYGVDRALKALYNPRTRRGLLVKRGGADAAAAVAEALDAARRFFAAIETALLVPRPLTRLRTAGPTAPLLDEPLDRLHRLVLQGADRLEDGRERDEWLDQAGRLKAIQAGCTEWLNLADAGQVYWAERTGRKQNVISLRSAPIDVAPELRRHLFGRNVSVVCTSATLALADEMGPFAGRVGADRARTVIVHSPFDYERCMRVFVAADVPLPAAEDARLSLDAVADYVRYCCLRVTGGSLVLFTSFGDLRAVAAAVEPDLARAGRPLLLQGEAMSRTELAQSMRRLGNAVLFGTDSFWTGVDVPGRALSQVIITRLPFDPPDHPVAEARAEQIRDAGGNPFAELMLPDALIKFRQGVGRLIRAQADRGVITILDARVLAKSYGRLFLGSLPQKEYVRMSRADREEKFQPDV